MADHTASTRTAAEQRWHVVSRWEEFAGEGRANLLRLIGLIIFYAVELINFHGLNLGFVEFPRVVDRRFHLAATLLTIAWGMLCLGVLVCRRQGIFPEWLKFLSTGCDLLLLTMILVLADGPRSPLVLLYFLIVVLASLRFSVGLVWFASAGSIVGYAFLLGFARWGAIPDWPKSDMSVPRHQQLIFVLAVALAGVVLGQVVRSVRRIAERYASVASSAAGAEP